MKVLDKGEKQLYRMVLGTVKIDKIKIKLIAPPKDFEGY